MSRGVDLSDPFEALPAGNSPQARRAESARKGDAADRHRLRVRRQAFLTVVEERSGIASLPGVLRARGHSSAGTGEATLAEGHFGDGGAPPSRLDEVPALRPGRRASPDARGLVFHEHPTRGRDPAEAGEHRTTAEERLGIAGLRCERLGGKADRAAVRRPLDRVRTRATPARRHPPRLAERVVAVDAARADRRGELPGCRRARRPAAAGFEDEAEPGPPRA